MKARSIEQLIGTQTEELGKIGRKVLEGKRITDEDALLLFEKGSLPYVGALANHVRENLHGDKTFFQP